MMIMHRILIFIKKNHLSQKEKEIEDEMSFHLEMSQAQFKSSGYSAKDALKKAEICFGDQVEYKNNCMRIYQKNAIQQRIFMAIILAIAVLFAIEQTMNLFDHSTWKKVSPFEAIEVDDQQVNVYLDQQWYQLHSINGFSANLLLSHAKLKFDLKAKKRFVEDIFEVLDSLDKLSDLNVDVELSKTDGYIIKKNLMMTKEKRRKVWVYANSRHFIDQKDS